MKKCLAFFLAAFFGVASGVLAASFFQVTAVSDGSMRPTYEQGDRILSIKASNAVSHGDVVLLPNEVFGSTGEGSVMMKRVIGLSGDRIKMEDGRVYLNGRILDESSYVFSETAGGDLKERKVPKGGAFVLGDNRGNSTDSRSRTVGMVKLQNLLGKVIYKW